MSCLDVMYQVFGQQPYFTSYGPYHHHHHHHAHQHAHHPQHQQKLALYSKMQDLRDSRPPLGPPGPPAIKEEDKDLPPGAEYLTSRCVLFTYFQGDVSSEVDEHFSRALSSTYSAVATGHKGARDGCFPMSQRSFPPSFWNSSYQPSVSSTLATAHSELSFPADPYSPAAAALHSHLHQPATDTWHPPHHHHHHHPYALGQGSAYSRPGVHEMYGAAFDPRYGSLLVPSVRPHHRSAPGPSASPCDLGGKGESGPGSGWSGTFTGTGPELGLGMDSGLQAQEKTKDLYWF
ncbi:unnamed protein product [Ophioblennius macclurei]